MSSSKVSYAVAIKGYNQSKNNSNNLQNEQTVAPGMKKIEEDSYNYFIDNQIKFDTIENQEADSGASSSNYSIIDELNSLINFDYVDNSANSNEETEVEDINCEEVEYTYVCDLRQYSNKLSIYASNFIFMCIEPSMYNMYAMASGSLHVAKSSSASENKYKDIVDFARDAWYLAQVFKCDICLQWYDLELEFVEHLLSDQHTRMINSRHDMIRFYVCETCHLFGCRRKNAKSHHFKSKSHVMYSAIEPYAICDMSDRTIEHLYECDQIFKSLITESNKASLRSTSIVHELVNDIVQMVRPVYPFVKAHNFGSRLAKLATCESDVDIFLDCCNGYNLSAIAEHSRFYVESILSHLKLEDSNTWLIEEVILEAKEPSIKMKHLNSNLHFDIYFSNGLGVEKTRLLEVYNTSYPRCRELILYIHKWLFHCRLSGYDAITKFSISWCVIFYLQTLAVVPSVKKLIKLKNESKNVGGWECGFIEKFKRGATKLTFKELVKEFFVFYREFDYQKNVICPFLGKFVSKHDFANPDQLPDSMDIYKKYANEHPDDIFRMDTCMCIQDPIELSQNTAQTVLKHNLLIFREYCSKSAEILQL